MLNDNAKLWVAALRSGEYQQGMHVLHNCDNELCCLGVACILFQKVTGQLKVEKDAEGKSSYDGDETVLPQIVRNWLGLETINGFYACRSTSLTQQNDSGRSFAEIADVIESEPPELFVALEESNNEQI